MMDVESVKSKIEKAATTSRSNSNSLNLESQSIIRATYPMIKDPKRKALADEALVSIKAVVDANGEVEFMPYEERAMLWSDSQEVLRTINAEQAYTHQLLCAAQIIKSLALADGISEAIIGAVEEKPKKWYDGYLATYIVVAMFVLAALMIVVAGKS